MIYKSKCGEGIGPYASEMKSVAGQIAFVEDGPVRRHKRKAYGGVSGEDSEASADRRDAPDKAGSVDRERVAQVIASQRDDGAWLTPGFVRDEQARKVEPAGGVVDSAVFIKRAELLSDFIRNSATP